MKGIEERDFAKENTFTFMTYNVWFESLKLRERMKALGDLVEQHQPHVICLQEVSPDIYYILCQSNWWTKYTCSVSQEYSMKRAYFCVQLSRLPVKKYTHRGFSNTIMGRELCIADVDVGNGKKLSIATTHLESPCPAPPAWNQYFSKERVTQAKESFTILKSLPNVIFGGDMNWDDARDGAPPLPDGWFDAWLKIRPNEEGWTYDTKSNQMLNGNRALRKRLDRIFCHLNDFEIESIDMIGKDPIPGLFYVKEKKIKQETKVLDLPVLPSDHFGLLLKFKPLG
eukprot:TRINITY_DN2167_c0_g1_i1.p1 TRINITY_DN2167_c0_g1~~TRINITY_DN2167_c0_g1_i1.p1  ORF type:complete len:284 (+),score=53.63 TRINITY_DN2167_c0_g1_i1:915-1766(+)